MISNFDEIKYYLLIGSAIFLLITVFFCLLRAILGPRFTDRIIAANIIGTKVIVLISIFALIIGEDYLIDICLICVLMSFLATVVLTKSVIEIENQDAASDSSKDKVLC